MLCSTEKIIEGVTHDTNDLVFNKCNDFLSLRLVGVEILKHPRFHSSFFRRELFLVSEFYGKCKNLEYSAYSQ